MILLRKYGDGMRMDRYEDTYEEKEDLPLSRTQKNQDMYKEVYMNSSYVDVNSLFNGDELTDDDNSEGSNYAPITYEEKNYNISDYLEKAHERLTPDNALRNLNDKNFTEQENEISKLIASIDEKEKDEEFFSDLMGDDEDTLLEGQVTRESITTTFEELTMNVNKNDNTKLNKALTEKTISNMKLEEDALNNTFQDILVSGLSKHKRRNIALIIFFITLFLLIAVIIIIFLEAN